MSEKSESLSQFHSSNMEASENYKDSDCALAIELNVTSWGWHLREVAMRGKRTSERSREAEQSLGICAQIRSRLRRDGTRCRRERREYNSDPKGSIAIGTAQFYLVEKGQQEKTVLGLKRAYLGG